MKTNLCLLLAFLGLITTSCTTDLNSDQQVNGKTHVTCTVDKFTPVSSTRTNMDPANSYSITWASGDVIGIFPQAGYQEPFEIPVEQVGKKTAQFDGGYWALKDGLKYNAYYPFDKTNFESTESKTQIPVTYLGQSQNGTTCCAGAFDYTYSDWTMAANGAVNFNFHHIGAILELSIPLPATTTYTSVTLKAGSSIIPTMGKYDLTAEHPAFISTATASSLSLALTNYNGTEGETGKFYMMVPPCDLSGTSLTVTLASATKTWDYTLTPFNVQAASLYQKDCAPIKVTSLSLATPSRGIAIDENFPIQFSILPANATNKALTWSSSDETIATVNENGEVTGIALGTVTITATTQDGSEISANVNVNVNILSAKDIYVDLGLPSKTKWAICNVGATSPEEFGDYFGWGETTPNCDPSSYKFYMPDKYYKFSKYSYHDNLTELQLSDDAAYVNWGPNFEMPSPDQLKELINTNYTTITLTTLNEISGFTITSKQNGNSIFLPAAGCYQGFILMNAYYWSNRVKKTLDGSPYYKAYYLYINTSLKVDNGDDGLRSREHCLPVRPVYKGK